MNIRRVVTAENEEGKSYIKEDGYATNVNFPLVEVAPEFKVTNLWTTNGDSLSTKYIEDPVAKQKFVPVTPERNNTS